MSSSTSETRVAQVGGSHYATGGVQHWDLCIDVDMHYLLACASKYVFRHRRKGGCVDLEKALSYLERYEQARHEGQLNGVSSRFLGTTALLEWGATARIDARDLTILNDIMCVRQHVNALAKIRQMIAEEYADTPQVEAAYRPGTPEDGGHHERDVVKTNTPRAGESNNARLARRRMELLPYGQDMVDSGGLFPASVTQHEYDHRLAPGIKDLYTQDSSSCLWKIEPGWQTYEIGRWDET